MERQKFRIKRKNSQFYGTPTCSTTGTTGLWPLNLSLPSVSGQTNACNNVIMYNSLGSQIVNAINGDMTTFPDELKDCSMTNPCAILWDVISPPFNDPTQCRNGDGDAWVQFKGLQYWSAGTPTVGTYNELIDLYQIYNADLTINILGQLGGWFSPILTGCFCENTFTGQDLSAVDVFLTQDFNDIGHYSIWDGNISQKDVFSNFLFTSFTPYNVQVFNTTDFEFYKNLPPQFTIDWGDGNVSNLVGGNLTAVNSYPMGVFATYMVTITQQTPWGPQSTSKALTVPNISYMTMLGQPYAPMGGGVPGYGTGGLQEAQNQTTLTGPPLYDPSNIPNGMFVGSATTYFGAYGEEGTADYLPLDTGIDILQYTGMSPTACFEVSGITESSIGTFQIYSSAPSNDPNLPPGYFINTPTPIGGDVENPLTNELENQLIGQIFVATPTYTGYTIQSSVPSSFTTPIDFYDFRNGVTIFIAQSCGLNANSFGGEECYTCPIQPCIYCEEKDEYIDRTTTGPTAGQAVLIEFNQVTNTNYAAQGLPWSPNTDYLEGDIVFDITSNICCCYMAVKDIYQSNPVFSSAWVGVPPAETNQGVWTDPVLGGLGEVHIWEPCCYFPDCECAPCPTGTLVPCNDPTLPAIWGGPNSANGGVWQNGTNYSTGQFISDTHGNCYKALQNGLLGEPTGATGSVEWEYTGCISWICPTDPINLPLYGCEPLTGTSITVINSYFPSPGMVFVGNAFYDSCIQDFNNGLCPYPERWVCDDQYSCGACIPIYPGQTSPNGYPYNYVGYPFSFVFSSQTDCNNWCNPPLYSCATPTYPCCTTIACNNQSQYFAITNMIPDGMSALDVLINYGLYQAPTYNLMDCQNNCCEVTYQWNCESGCTVTPFATIPPNPFGVGPVGGPQTLADCQALNNGGAAGINQNPPVACGWSCTTPSAVYNPVPPDPYGLGYYSSPCTPCYTSNCAPFPDELSCISGCSDPSTCYICDCSTNTGYQSFTPCPTPTTLGSNVFGANNGIASGPASPVYGSAYDNVLSYATPAAAISADCCDFGWDCWVINDPNDPNNGQPNGDGCTYYANWTLLPPSLTASTNGPYSSHTECCVETSCCYAECDDVLAMNTTYSNTVQPTGFFPCVYMSALTSNFMSCHPINPAPASPANPYCSIADCYADINPTNNIDVECDDGTLECICCSAYTWTQYGLTVPLQDRGTFIWGSLQNYQIYDTVSHFDPDSPECCYVCMCPNLGGGAAGLNGVFDCDGFIPDDGPAPTGQPNCWENCTYKAVPPSPFTLDITYDMWGTVTNVSPSHCPVCDPAYSAQTYECTADGCQPSGCIINGSFTMTSQNCYDNINCIGVSGQHECDAGCYCEEGPGGSGPPPWSNTGCVVLQDWLNQTDNIHTGGYPSYPGLVPAAGYPNNIIPFPSGTYPFATLNICLTLITGGLDCCDDPRYYCDHLWQCGQPLPAGQGCQPVYPGDSNYLMAPFSSLALCQDFCRWECDDQGLGVCQFVANSTAPIFFLSGPDCEIAYTNCDCKPVTPDEWWCDNSGFVGTTPSSSNCIMVPGGVTPPNPLNSWGIDPVTLQPCLYGSPGCFFFGSQAICESYCRFCCDVAPPGTSFCQLDWGNQVCDISLYDCTQTSIMLYGSYPCLYVPNVEFCCDDTLGCISYVGAMPAGCVYGPYTSMANCQTECNFLCDDCVPTCECIFVGPMPGGCGLATPYSSITQCETAVSIMVPPVIYGAKGCCDCWECETQGGVYYEIQNSLGLWVGQTQTVNLSTLPAQVWNPGQIYNIGDVVLAGDQPGADPTCCYVLVYDHVNWNMHPATSYANYLTAYNNNIQTLHNWAWWIPCDPKCPDAGPVTGWECEPGMYDFSCLSKQIKFGDGVPSCCGHCPGGGGGYSVSIPGVNIGRCTAMYPVDVLRLYSLPLNNQGGTFWCAAENVNISVPSNASGHLQNRKYEYPNTDATPGGHNNVSGCCEGCNLLDDPLDIGSDEGGCLYGINYFKVTGPIDYLDTMSANYCVGLTANFTRWIDFISALNVCGIHPGGTPWNATMGPAPPYNVYFDDVATYLQTDPNWGGIPDDWLYINWEFCRCNDLPCYCYEITGMTGTYPTQSACEQDCCQYWECTDDPVTGAPCTCVPLPLGVVGPYPTLSACTDDPLQCCNNLCEPCIGQYALEVVKQEFDGLYNPYSTFMSATVTIGNGLGGTTQWYPNGVWDYNEVTVSPLDGCCYISNQDMNHAVWAYSSYDPAICYDMFLQGLACDGSNIGSPTQVLLDQNDMTPWWPCDEDCAGIVPSGRPSGSGPCKLCCQNTITNNTMILNPNTVPCQCPIGWVQLPTLADCGPSPSGWNPVSACAGVPGNAPNSMVFVDTHINAGFPTTFRFCHTCNYGTPANSGQALATGICKCCDNIGWNALGNAANQNPLYSNTQNPYAWI